MTRALTLAAALLLLPCAALAHGEAAVEQPGPLPACGPHEEMLKLYLSRFGEVPVMAGIAKDGRMMEVLASPGGKTWTILKVTASGRACGADFGEVLFLAPIPPGPRA